MVDMNIRVIFLMFLLIFSACANRGQQKYTSEDIMCTGVYQPVCGENGKTYNNGCLADLDRTTIACQKTCPCDGSATNDCDDVYKPVCGIDEQTYANACEARLSDTSVACSGQCPCRR
jgi:Kazal-type serine protease inhibitor domain